MPATSGEPIIVRDFTEFSIPVTLGILSLVKCGTDCGMDSFRGLTGSKSISC